MITILGYTLTLAFIVSTLPAPFLLYYNYRVLIRLRILRKLARGKALRYPRIYHQGKALGVISGGFAVLPAVIEWRFFVLNPFWSILYLLGGLLGVLALRMALEGLNSEIQSAKKSKATPRHK